MESNSKFSAVILSAGYSSRMGQFKPLLKFGEKTALELLVETFINCEIEDIIVVLGYKSEEIIEKLKNIKVKWIINSDYNEGMYTSIKSGVINLEESSKGFFLIPVDIPIIKKSTIENLKIEYLKGEKGIIYPLFNGKRGHPPLISASYRKNIIENMHSSGLRDLLDLYKEDSKEVSVVDLGTIKDMDTPMDYNALKEYYNLRDVPNYEECKALWNKYSLPLHIVEHCKTVAYVACNIGKLLIKNDYNIDLNKIRSAALLHDIGRMEKNHEEVGAKILRDLGYDAIADIVRAHMDINTNIKYNNYITEEEIVYLADKMVLGKDVVTLEDRFNKSIYKYKDNPEIIENINLKFKNCLIILDKVKKVIGEYFLYEG